MISTELQKDINLAALSEVKFAESSSIRDRTSYPFHSSGKASLEWESFTRVGKIQKIELKMVGLH